MSSKEKADRGAVDKLVLFNHIKEECVKDPFYMTKIIVGAVGKNALAIVVRIAIYVLVVYPVLTVVLGVPQGVAALLTVAGIILYHSAGAIYHRISDEAAKGAIKGEPLGASQTIKPTGSAIMDSSQPICGANRFPEAFTEPKAR